MTAINRRQLGVRLGAGAGVVLVEACGFGPFAIAQGQGAAKVVIVGGGPGGATVANRLKRAAPALDVTLIEERPIYTTCFFSNLYLAGFRSFEQIQHGYDGIARLGVKIVHARASAIDTAARTVTTAGGTSFAYDRLVVAPGIDIKYDAIPGYSQAVAQQMPHAYIAGAQTLLLKQQLDAMPDGGTVVIAPPNNPYRCPPGPYERACLIAHYIKTRKPKSKLVIFDPKQVISKQEVFQEAFKRYYEGIIELNLTNEIDDFALASVDAKAMTVTTKAGQTVRADVANVIPNQRAGEIAIKSGLAEGDWCPIDPRTFASKKAADVYVIGDAAIGVDMPKSAYAANSQANVVAADILAALAAREKSKPTYRNTCWSLLAPGDTVKLGADYAPNGAKLEASGAFISKPGEGADVRRANTEEGEAWYQVIVEDVFANGAKVPAK